MITSDDQLNWLKQAEQLKPTLRRTAVAPTRYVKVMSDPNAFQGWRVADADAPKQPLGRGDTFVLDFGNHFVGTLSIKIIPVGAAPDSPARIKFTFAEVPAEVAEPFDPYDASLSRAWLQDETVTVDVVPAEFELPRRYAFRYLKVEVVDTSLAYKIRLEDFRVNAISSADPTKVPALPQGLPEDVRRIEAVALRTLQNCMMTVFEDGPKRDRRLWLGDLRLQAMANAVTFQQFDLVRRCLLLFAAFPRPDGLVMACVFEHPTPHIGQDFIWDYAALFGPTLLDYVKASDDRATGDSLFPVARRQIETLLTHVTDGLWTDPPGWTFIDWHKDLHRSTPMQAVLVYALRQTLNLADELGRFSEVAHLRQPLDAMIAASREKLRDRATGLYVSGPDRQVSYASQAWATLAGIATADEAAQLFRLLPKVPDAIPPAGPYLQHHVVDAMFAAGLHHEAVDLLRRYWGAMVDLGADTFWEVFDPANEKLSPYRLHLVNSYCHAWSCTPTYFIRKYPQAFL